MLIAWFFRELDLQVGWPFRAPRSVYWCVRSLELDASTGVKTGGFAALLKRRQQKRQLNWAYLKIQVLEERLRLQRIQKYGPASEKLSDAQLELLELEPGVSNLEVQAESAREPLLPGPKGTPRT